MRSGWQEQKRSQQKRKKLLETRTDSCMPRTGARKAMWAPAWHHHSNLAESSSVISLRDIEVIKQYTRGWLTWNSKLTCFQIQLWASLHEHLWCNPKRHVGIKIFSVRDSDEVFLHVNIMDSCLVNHARTNTVTEHPGLFESQDITSLTQFSGCEFCAG